MGITLKQARELTATTLFYLPGYNGGCSYSTKKLIYLNAIYPSRNLTNMIKRRIKLGI